jgi:predicted Mrr-cat superfamily restriction endonuclease
VIYPSKRDRKIHIGEIAGPYQYDPKPEEGYPQRRAVKWMKSFPRTKFSQGALYEIGSAMSFFVDIIAHKDELGFEPPFVNVQVKSTESSIGDPIVSQLYGKVERSEYGMVVTLGTFTNQAENFARNKSNLRLIDGEELVGLILQHYEQFDSKYKGLLPLKRVYVPEHLEEAET